MAEQQIFDLTNVEVPCLSKVVEVNSDPVALRADLEDRIGGRPLVLGEGIVARVDPVGVSVLSNGMPFAGHVPRPIPAMTWMDHALYASLSPGGEYTVDSFPPATLDALLSNQILVPSDGSPGGVPVEIRAGYSNLPMKAVVEVTAACQCGCPFTCYLKDTLDGYMPSIDELLARVDATAELGIPIVEVSGGEATLRQKGRSPDLVRVFERIEQNGQRHYMVSNGEFLAEKVVFDALLPYLLRGGVAISVDGDAQTHDKFRGRDGLYRKLETTFDLLQKHDVPRIISATIGPYNIDYLKDIMDLGVRFDIPVFVRPVADIGNASSADNTTSGTAMWETVNDVLRSDPKYGQYALNAFIVPGSQMSEAISFGCNAGHKGIRIDPNGAVYGCYLDIEHPEGQLIGHTQESLSMMVADFTAKRMAPYEPCRTCAYAAPNQADVLNPAQGACYGPCDFSRIAKDGTWVQKNLTPQVER